MRCLPLPLLKPCIPAGGRLYKFPLSPVMNIIKHMSLCHSGVSFGFIPKSSIAGSSGRSISNFLKNHLIDFLSGCTSLQSLQEWKSVPLFIHLLQHVSSPEVLILAINIGVRWNFRVILICMSLITKDFEHFFGASQLFKIPQFQISA